MKKLFTIFCGLAMTASAFAQEVELTGTEKLERRIEALESAARKQGELQVSGYIQTQLQWGQPYASMKVGAANEKTDESFSRIGIRRGRIKFVYNATSLISGVFQLDMTEKGVGFKDAYFNVKDPWVNSIQFRAGIFDRPFGNEISYSSSKRESPERSMLFQTLFPDERDLGAMLVLQAPKTSPVDFLKLEAGLFAGNGIKPEIDNRRDFIGHLSAIGKFDNLTIGGGVSYYNGGVYQGSPKVYTMQGSEFVENDNDDNEGKFARREYFGADLQLTFFSAAGMTQLRGEYIQGRQPGSDKSSKSPNWTTLPTTDTYIRNFSGWYAIFIQDLGSLPFSVVAKYDVYDPNTKVGGDDVGLGHTSKTDLAYNTLGLGALWRMGSALRLQAYYEIVRNEKSANVGGFETDRKDNLFTLRLQYKF